MGIPNWIEASDSAEQGLRVPSHAPALQHTSGASENIIEFPLHRVRRAADPTTASTPAEEDVSMMRPRARRVPVRRMKRKRIRPSDFAAEYDAAQNDPVFQEEIAELDRAFDVTVGDGLQDED